MNRKLRSFILLVLVLIGSVALVSVGQQAKAQTQEQEDDPATDDGSREQDEGDDDQDNGVEDDATDDVEAYAPPIVPANFVDPTQLGTTIEANAYFPLIAGVTYIYKGGSETITVTVTEDTKVIEGITCVVIHDVVEENGEIIEDTYDWYAQDKDGNVWYFGEDTKAFKDGEASTEGSWTAGVDEALPGVVMSGKPEVGMVYRQEYYAGHAEDMGKVVNLNESATTPAASCDGTCLVTEDTTPLEPDLLEHKYYAPNIGLILEVNPKTGEKVELVEIKH
jgi:hypothetical protein